MYYNIYIKYICIIYIYSSPFHTVLITVALWYSLKSGSLIPLAPFFSSRLLWLFGVFCVSIEISRFFCSNYVKNAIGNLIGIALNLQIALGSIVIFTILILPIQENSISLHLLVSSLISFINVLQFSAYRSYFSLGRFIPRYFILFVAMVNGIASLISLSDFSSLVHRNARDFCALILYPATLQN